MFFQFLLFNEEADFPFLRFRFIIDCNGIRTLEVLNFWMSLLANAPGLELSKQLFLHSIAFLCNIIWVRSVANCRLAFHNALFTFLYFQVSVILNDSEECTVAVTSNKYATFPKIRSGPLRLNNFIKIRSQLIWLKESKMYYLALLVLTTLYEFAKATQRCEVITIPLCKGSQFCGSCLFIYKCFHLYLPVILQNCDRPPSLFIPFK